MPTISAISQSPIAKYLLDSKATAKRLDSNTIHFLSQDNILIGEMKKSGYRGEREVITKIYDKDNNPIFENLLVIKKIVKDLIINKKNCAVVPQGYSIYSETKDFSKNTITTEVKTRKLISKLKKGDYNCDFKIFNTDGKIKYAEDPQHYCKIESAIIS